MAKNSFPMMPSGGGILSKVISTVVALALLVLVVKHPADAASWITGVVHAAGAVIDGISTFFQHISGR